MNKLFEYYVCECGSSGPPRWNGKGMAPKNTANYGLLIGGKRNVASVGSHLHITKSYEVGSFYCYNCGAMYDHGFGAPMNWIGAYIET